ncbi:MAG: ABC transporter ATP-binding protein [Gemmatimonadales bacterium]|nr:MAG: ABC transporter ATP-binding protein [Gemmatimonadales bacterium]
MILELTAVTRRFGEVTAVDELSLGIEAGEFVTLLGPSGCGKTTALRLIAGFESPDEGSIHFRGREVSAETPQKRGFGMVFQNYALFPHLNVFENVAFGLKSRGRPRDQIAERVRSSLARVDLAGYQDRAVQALSGGQQQRVALARALAIEPPLLLLDEPLSNLDQALRVQTRTELRRLVKELEMTALFVTHDQEEAFDLSDRIAVMRAGRLCQIGTPADLYQAPADRFVAGFMGRANFVPAALLPGRDEPGDLLIRPEELEFTGEAHAQLTGIVRDRRFRGPLTLYRIEVGALDLEVAHRGPGPRVGETAWLRPRPDAELPSFAPIQE